MHLCSPFVLLWRSFRVYLCGCLSVWLFRAFCLVCCTCFEKLFPKVFHFKDKKVATPPGRRAPCLSLGLALSGLFWPLACLTTFSLQFPPRAESIVDPNEPPFEDSEFYGMGLGTVSEKVRWHDDALLPGRPGFSTPETISPPSVAHVCCRHCRSRGCAPTKS